MAESSTTSGVAPIPTNAPQNVGQNTGDDVSPIYVFSSGLIQISGISTLFGGSAVEEQAIGFKAAAGFAWAPMSCFGILKIVRVCIAGAVSDYWRDILGLRNAIIDDAVGFTLWTDATKPQKPSSFIEKKFGIRMDFQSGVNQDSHDPADRVQHDYRQYRVSGWHSSFALDRQLKTNFASILPFKDNQEISVHCFIPDETVPDSRLMDWIMILASTIKLVEIITLHRLGSQVLWWSTALGWIFCFTAAVILQCCNAARDNPKNIRSTADFLIGKLPSYNRTGGSSKRIILGQPISIRGNPLWRLTWIVGALSNLVGIGATFYALTKEMEASTKVMYAWVSFQAGWLVLRSIAYHIIPNASGAYNENMTPQSWKKASSLSRTRTLRLLLATSIHQIHEHVHRGFFAYQEDMLSLTSPQQLALVLQQASWQTTDILPIDIFLGLGKTKINAIIGDSWLRTLVWITGAKVDNAEMYDTVVVLVQAPSGTKYLIPGVRVMAMIRSSDDGDLERKIPSFDPRGRANTGSPIQWIYWIPITTETEPGKYGWLEIKGDPFSVLGPLRNYRVLSGMELDKHLRAGVLNISLQGTVDMEKVLEASRLSAGLTLQMVSQEDMLQ